LAKDKYQNFATLSRAETRGTDYGIRVVRVDSPVAIIAPHGGYIERGTSQLASGIALDSFNLYCFEGLREGREHCELHITSTRFDEPQCVDLVRDSDWVVAVHGRADENDAKTIWLGGLDVVLRDRIAAALERADFLWLSDPPKHRAQAADNICNRGRRGRGVQLEFPLSLRKSLLANQFILDRLASAIRAAIAATIRPPVAAPASPPALASH
jgi:phage replication-related protein YjqB (UPF0714/DUF867 family)